VIAALVVVAGACVFLWIVWWSQERVLFQPPHYEAEVQLGRINYEASDGQPLTGYLVGEPAAAKGALLCFHGNADLAMWQLTWARAVTDRTGFTVVLAEYRGYMSLGGTPTYATAKLDGVAYFGHSLGSAVAAELAQSRKPRALLLQSPFTSASAMARRILTPVIARFWSLVSRVHFYTTGIVATLDVPVAVAHGKRDRIVPFEMGMAVYGASRVKGPLLVVDDAGHNDIPALAGERYWNWMAAALGVTIGPSDPICLE
jgi:uncharacterized protein